MTLRETDLVVNEGLTISGKSMREHLEVINHQEAIAYIKHLMEKNTPLNEREVLSIHNLILRGINPEDAGRYRRVQVDDQRQFVYASPAFYGSQGNGRFFHLV